MTLKILYVKVLFSSLISACSAFCESRCKSVVPKCENITGFGVSSRHKESHSGGGALESAFLHVL